ncbi:MAG: cytochrome c [Anaeromyxobacter sp.]
MKRLVVALVLVLSAAAARADGDGAAVYASKCKACHGPDGKGTPMGIKMGAKDLAATKLSEKEIVTVIENGRGKMPKQASIGHEAAEDVAEYVKKGLK